MLILQALFSMVINNQSLQNQQKMQAHHNLEQLLNARIALIYSQAQDPQHFMHAFNFIRHAYNQNPSMDIYSSQTQPNNMAIFPTTKLFPSFRYASHLEQQLLRQHVALFATRFPQLNNTWVMFETHLPAETNWDKIFLFLIVDIFIMVGLWACFLLYYRHTLPVEVLEMIEGKHPKKNTTHDPIMRHFKQKVQNYFDEKNLMITALAHDIKTPLTEAMLRLEFSEDQETAQPILANLQHIKDIITSSLQYSQEQRKIQKNQVEIVSLLENLTERYQDEQFTAKVKTDIHYYELDIEIELFKRMVTNILDNAKRYATECVVEIHHKPRRLYLRFIDNGMGVPEKYLDRLTTPYFRVDQARPTGEGNTGLGLAIVRKIAELHDGEVSFSNLGDQSGFQVSLCFRIAS